MLVQPQILKVEVVFDNMGYCELIYSVRCVRTLSQRTPDDSSGLNLQAVWLTHLCVYILLYFLLLIFRHIILEPVVDMSCF